ncbi:WD40 repeat domain-containing protein [Candidatus Laterigemmans baculatus]|uniref:WD40 repeat domain-containing protein n=1 Tax=Candidatus Laterigemmans baculatus TaxID=2770505 RepID=UPI0013DA4736|nr:hypothetical protein [Candidatus Laterigemmans baculatus]
MSPPRAWLSGRPQPSRIACGLGCISLLWLALPLAAAVAQEQPVPQEQPVTAPPATAPPSTAPPITALAWAPDGRSVVVGSQLGLRLLSVPSLREIPSLREVPSLRELARQSGDASMILSLDFHGDRLLVGGGEPGESGFLAVTGIAAGTDGKPSGWLPFNSTANGFTDFVCAARWSPDGQRFAAASFDGTAAVWEAAGDGRGARYRQTLRFEGHSAAVTDVAWLTSDRLASSSRDATIRVWNPRDGRLIRTLNQHTQQVIALAMPHRHEDLDGNNTSRPTLPLMASIGDDRTVRFWQPTIGRLIRFARLSDERPVCHCWTPDGTAVVVGTTAGRLLEIEAATTKILRAEPISDDWITALAIALDRTLLYGTSTGELKLIDF